MAYEPAVIEQWIYETLSGDATLLGLLAPDNQPNGYQMRRVAERYARKEKALKSGYQTADTGGAAQQRHPSRDSGLHNQAI